MPLAYRKSKKGTFTQNLLDLVNLDHTSSIIDNDNLNTNYSMLQKQVLDNFSKIEIRSDDPKSSHDEIAEIMIEILKNFHVYWNSLRLTDNLDRVKVET